MWLLFPQLLGALDKPDSAVWELLLVAEVAQPSAVEAAEVVAEEIRKETEGEVIVHRLAVGLLLFQALDQVCDSGATLPA